MRCVVPYPSNEPSRRVDSISFVVYDRRRGVIFGIGLAGGGVHPCLACTPGCRRWSIREAVDNAGHCGPRHLRTPFAWADRVNGVHSDKPTNNLDPRSSPTFDLIRN